MVTSTNFGEYINFKFMESNWDEVHCKIHTENYNAQWLGDERSFLVWDNIETVIELNCGCDGNWKSGSMQLQTTF